MWKKESTEERHFISNLPMGIGEIVRAVLAHWMVESYHWHLDVTFREDENHALEKQAAYNLNIMKKLSLNILKLIEVGSKALSLKKRQFIFILPLLPKILQLLEKHSAIYF